MKYVINCIRVVVGVIFIISGLVKLNDPVGFAIKLEEYFSKPVLNMPVFEPFAMAIGILVCITEVTLGVMLLVGYLKKLTLWLLIAMTVYFGFLTFYSAYFNKVTDCGCFGDAIKFTPWQSFTKDMVLLALVLILFWGQKYIKPIAKGMIPLYFTLAGIIVSALVVNYTYKHLPIKDFRPYKIGANIPEGMVVPEGAPLPKYEYHWRFIVDGKEKVVTTNGKYPKVNGEFKDVTTEMIDKGYVPPIHDFYIEGKDRKSYFDDFMKEEKLMMVVSEDIGKADVEAFKAVKVTTDRALKEGYTVIGLTSTLDKADKLVKDYELNFRFYYNDEKTLKTMIRSNPGVIILNKGTIKMKKHYYDLEKLKL